MFHSKISIKNYQTTIKVQMTIFDNIEGLHTVVTKYVNLYTTIHTSGICVSAAKGIQER